MTQIPKEFCESLFTSMFLSTVKLLREDMDHRDFADFLGSGYPSHYLCNVVEWRPSSLFYLDDYYAISLPVDIDKDMIVSLKKSLLRCDAGELSKSQLFD